MVTAVGEHEWHVGWLSDAPSPPSHRITLTLPVLNAAHQIAFIVQGSEKADVLADALERTVQSDVPMEEDRDLPAALVKAGKRPVVWLVDEAAAPRAASPRARGARRRPYSVPAKGRVSIMAQDVQAASWAVTSRAKWVRSHGGTSVCSAAASGETRRAMC